MPLAGYQVYYVVGRLGCGEVDFWLGVGIVHSEFAGIAAAVYLPWRTAGGDEAFDGPGFALVEGQCREHSINTVSITS